MNQYDENIEYNSYVTGVPVNQEVRDLENAQFLYWMRKYGVTDSDSNKFRYIREYCMKGATVDSDGVLQVPQDAVFHHIGREKNKIYKFHQRTFRQS